MIVDDEGSARQGAGGLQGLFRLLRRHKLMIALPIGLGLLGACQVFLATPKRYEATAVVALDVRKVTVLPGDLVVSRLPQENPALRTEIDILTSRSMADRVIARVGNGPLAPLQAEEAVGPGWLAAVRSAFGRLASSLAEMAAATGGSMTASTDAVPAPTPEQRREQLIDNLIGRLHVGNDGRSYTIHISFAANAPDLAARVANTYAEEYLAHQTDLKLEAVRAASDWLGKKVKDLKVAVEQAEQEVEAFKRSEGLFEIGNTSIEDHRLDVLSAELVRARASAAEARARLETAASLTREESGLATFSEALKSPIIVALREQQAALLREHQGLQDMGALKSSRLPAIQSQLRSLQEQITAEVDRVLKSLRNELAIAERRERDLEKAIQVEIAASSRADEATVRLNQLEREADANRTLLETLLNRYKTIIEQDDLAGPEAQLISRAQPPSVPNSPKLMPLLALGLFLGCLGGLGAAYLREHHDDRIWSADVLEDRSGLPVLGAIPSEEGWLDKLRIGALGPSMADVSGPALKRIYAVLRLYPMSRNAKVMAFTSALPGEGKTFLSIAVGRAAAAAGEAVLIIDADVHDPSLAARLGLAPTFCWEDILDAQRSVDEILQRDPHSNAMVLAPAPAPLASPTLFTASAFSTLMAILRNRYDRIIIDTPPVSGSAEAAILGGLADATMLVVRWRTTTHKAVVEALRQMALCSAPVTGIVLNRLNPRSTVRYANRRLPTSPRQPAPASPVRPIRPTLKRV